MTKGSSTVVGGPYGPPTRVACEDSPAVHLHQDPEPITDNGEAIEAALAAAPLPGVGTAGPLPVLEQGELRAAVTLVGEPAPRA